MGQSLRPLQPSATWASLPLLNGSTAAGLNEFFDRLVLGPSVQWLIDNEFLARPRYFARRVTPDLSSVRKMAGDFSKSESEAIMDKPSITGDAVAHYKRHLYRTAVAFCVNGARGARRGVLQVVQVFRRLSSTGN